jgi:PIN domain nuclease of toxin-antitoxin system
MRALLDTHVFLWWITDHRGLSALSREFISDSANELFLSAASGWEMAIKMGLGKLKLRAKLDEFISEHMSTNSIIPLPIEMSHALHILTLPLIHRDPFDRLLIAQAQRENLSLITSDPIIGKYDVPVIW